jgi:hypothetical protein
MQDSSFNTIKRLKVSRELSGELEQTMRGYLKHLLEKEIKSIAWLDTLKQQG